MAVITLTTDFGLKDHFVGAIKGTIYKELAEAKIVDISHEISPFNIQECAYILKNSYKAFPEGTIHIVGVDSEPTSRKSAHCRAGRRALFYQCQQWRGKLNYLRDQCGKSGGNQYPQPNTWILPRSGCLCTGGLPYCPRG